MAAKCAYVEKVGAAYYVRNWMTFYNHQRPHSALSGKPPALAYWQRNDINRPDQQMQRVA